MTLEQTIVEAARREGFVLVGFARLRRLDEREEFYHRWLDANRHADMSWLARDPERRFDPRVLDPRLRSVVSLGYPYDPPAPPTVNWRAELRGRIAAYAFGLDYHDRVLKKAQSIAGLIAAMRPGGLTRNYVDTGPVFEREWAAESGLGWVGKNTNLLNREHGSYFFLSEIFTDIELEPNRELYRDHCGTCRRCLDLCPTGALADGFVMDARLCISYLTIENRGPIDPECGPSLAIGSSAVTSASKSARGTIRTRPMPQRNSHPGFQNCWRSTMTDSGGASARAPSSARNGVGFCATSAWRSATVAIPTR